MTVTNSFLYRHGHVSMIQFSLLFPVILRMLCDWLRRIPYCLLNCPQVRQRGSSVRPFLQRPGYGVHIGFLCHARI